MKLYTSSYTICKRGNLPVAAISIKPPDDYTGRRYSKLAPVWDIVNKIKAHQITPQQYTDEYLRLLNKRRLDPYQVAEELGDGTIMLCYEQPGKFCHRHIVAKWITNHTGIEVVEYMPTYEKSLDKFFTF